MNTGRRSRTQLRFSILLTSYLKQVLQWLSDSEKWDKYLCLCFLALRPVLLNYLKFWDMSIKISLMIISQHCGLPFVGAPRFLAVLREKKIKTRCTGVHSDIIWPEFTKFLIEMIGAVELFWVESSRRGAIVWKQFSFLFIKETDSSRVGSVERIKRKVNNTCLGKEGGKEWGRERGIKRA